MYRFGEALGGSEVPPGTSVLVAGPPLSGKRSVVREVLADGIEDGEGAIVISTRDTASRVREAYDLPTDGEGSERVAILDCVTEHIGRSEADTDLVKYAGAPKDMSGIEIKFSEVIEDFYGERGIQRNRVVLDSITTLLLYANLQQVFHFLHAITGRIEEIGAVGVFVVDDTVHDDQTMATVRQQFDGEIRTAVDEPPEIRLPTVDESTGVVES